MTLAITVDLVLVAPVIFLGSILHRPWLSELAWYLFVALWAIAFSCGAFWLIRLFSGRYTALRSQAWRDQMW